MNWASRHTAKRERDGSARISSRDPCGVDDVEFDSDFFAIRTGEFEGDGPRGLSDITDGQGVVLRGVQEEFAFDIAGFSAGFESVSFDFDFDGNVAFVGDFEEFLAFVADMHVVRALIHKGGWGVGGRTILPIAGPRSEVEAVFEGFESLSGDGTSEPAAGRGGKEAGEKVHDESSHQ